MSTTVRNDALWVPGTSPTSDRPQGTTIVPGAPAGGRRRRRLLIAPVVLCAIALTLLSACVGVDQSNALKVLSHDRSADGLAAVLPSTALSPNAQAHAQTMAADGYLYHTDLRLGRGECAMGENVGYGSSISAVERAFMASPPHRANILNGRFNRVCLGVARGHGLVWVVQLFVTTC